MDDSQGASTMHHLGRSSYSTHGLQLPPTYAIGCQQHYQTQVLSATWCHWACSIGLGDFTLQTKSWPLTILPLENPPSSGGWVGIENWGSMLTWGRGRSKSPRKFWEENVPGSGKKWPYLKNIYPWHLTLAEEVPILQIIHPFLSRQNGFKVDVRCHDFQTLSYA